MKVQSGIKHLLLQITKEQFCYRTNEERSPAGDDGVNDLADQQRHDRAFSIMADCHKMSIFIDIERKL